MTLYATYFDSNFLVRGLACLQSLTRSSRAPVRVLVLALDRACEEALRRLWPSTVGNAQLEILPLEKLEETYPELKAVKSSRAGVEYYFTLTPFLCAYAVGQLRLNEVAVYIDADLYFYGDPGLALAAMGNADVAVVEHRYPESLAKLSDIYGRFNVGWLAFRSGPEATRCIDVWQQQCLDHCSDRPDGDRFGDQKYLDAWPETVSSLAIVDEPGVNLAPWNVGRHYVTRGADNVVLVDGAPLVFFHFHHLARLATSIYETDFGMFGRIGPVLAEDVYRPYLEALDRLEADVAAATGWSPQGRLHRFDRTRTWTLKSTILAALRIGRLFTRQRAIFEKGVMARPWRRVHRGG